ncbi:MAG: hypothetical protein M3R57_10745 [Chloroflexota bacterium]|nr:hypothetical protein [Chloroflexota bacterium]
MSEPVAGKPVMPITIGAAPAALVALVGVLGLVFQTNPVRPFADGAWASSDIVGLLVIGVVVGLLNRSVSGLVGTIIGASAAIAIQLFVLTEQASHTTNVAASLREPSWSGQISAALAIGIASLIGGFVVGALAGRALTRVQSRGAAMRPPAALGRGVVTVVLTLVGAAVLALALVGSAATSAYVPAESQPVLRVLVEGDRIVAAPETVPAGRVAIDVQRTGGTLERWVSIAGPLPPELEAILDAGNDPLVGGWSRPFAASGEPVRHTAQADLWPGRYAVVVSTGYPEMGPEDTEIPPVPALDVRRFVVTGPEPVSFLAATGGPIVAIGYQLSLAITGWATASSLLVVRRRRNRAAAVVAGLVAAGLMWLVVSFTIHQSHSPF